MIGCFLPKSNSWVIVIFFPQFFCVNFLSEDQTFSYIVFNLLVWWFTPFQVTDILQKWVTRNVIRWRRLMGLLQVEMSAGRTASYWKITFNDRGLVVTTEYEACSPCGCILHSFYLTEKRSSAWKASDALHYSPLSSQLFPASGGPFDSICYVFEILVSFFVRQWLTPQSNDSLPFLRRELTSSSRRRKGKSLVVPPMCHHWRY